MFWLVLIVVPAKEREIRADSDDVKRTAKEGATRHRHTYPIQP
jgi:hypothetical protein